MTATSDMSDIDLRSRTVALEQRISEHQGRLGELEKWQRQSEIFDARKEEQLKGMEARIDVRFASVEKAIADSNESTKEQFRAMNDSVSWLVRLIIGALIAGILSGLGIFIIKGMGFNVP